MDFQHRRDAYCGKFSVTNVLTQYNVPFTVLKPHVVHPLSPKFQENLRDFAAICEGHVKEILKEAFTTYLGYDWVDID